MFVEIFLLVALGLTVFNFYVRNKKSGRMANKIPGPTAYPIIGNMLSFDVSSPVVLWETMRSIAKKYYPITRLWFATEAIFCIMHPDDFEILLSSQKATTKAYVYDLLHPWLRTGLVTSKGEKWRHRRKILTPAFHFNILSKYMEITKEQGDNMIEYLKSQGNETIQELESFCSNVTLNIICESAMGVSFDSDDDNLIKKYKEAIYTLGRIAVYRMPRPYIHDWMLKLVPFLKINRDQRAAIRDLHQLTDKIYKERKKYHEKTGYKFLEGLTDDVNEAVNDLYMVRKKRLAMLDLLLSAERDGLIDEEGIKEEVDTFTFGGHDTTAVCIMWTLMLLAEHKEFQDIAREEVNATVNASGGKFGFSEVQDLNYLERCIKESLRIYPTVPTILRYIEEDLPLKHGTIPGKSHMLCSIYDVHMDPNFWPEPKKYDPDRFLPENSRNRHPFAYAPFSAGPRNCIGQKFALHELKSLIGRILLNFYLEPVDRLKDVQLTADLMLRPSKSVRLKFIQIKS